MKEQRIALYGGTFDPIHNGHLILARDALEQLELDRVVFLPAKISPHKLESPPSDARLRLAVLEASVEGEKSFCVDPRELSREGPSFTVDTVREFRREIPMATIYYLIGEDNLAALHTWKEIDELRSLVQFVVLSRSGTDGTHGFPIVPRRVEISSTEIRKRVAAGLTIRYMVPVAACELIKMLDLYRDE